MPPDLAAVGRLRRLAARFAGETADADATWFAGRIEVYLENAPAGLDLDGAFDLTVAPGTSPWWQRERRAARDELLRQLAAALPGSCSARAHALAERLRRYAGSGWPLDRRRGAPMPDTPERRALFRLFSLDADPPTSLRRLHEILSS